MVDIFPYFPSMLLVFVRVTSFFLMMPIFSYRTIPNAAKIGIGFFLAWIMIYTIDAPVLEIDGTYFLLIIKEALVGIFVGFIAYLMLSAIQIAGGFIDFQMGFAIANVIDPQTGAQSPLTGQYLYMISLLFLLSVNGHHLLMDGIFYSYQFIPIDQPWIPFGDEGLAEFVVKAFNSMFIIAFQMAIPVVGSLFLVDVALGIIARTVPQLNVFVVGLPVKIGVSFIVLFIVMSVLMVVVSRLFETMLETMRGLLSLMGGL
ncbi:flagellar biosynthesis protein FliR [Cytobacillus horneckiae]|uniref:Flagellar biosynthetic protein FliR n=1 Tax=Cytobacillus horneckiae TaxID=549687 RepID=A0A2N0ZM04_9BACI|nr:flagellar biosynthetic protein FliR [Cytobacillus horneckiae]MBN6887179.1 flagellar type III secretion system protein FliR [Cytobacillus horneckiae]MEC1157030.1 flagellar biosynthetic protein FliR [Cytobacillus horneckiae]MED2939944.1 flagellar biosynthetic protein FliR [Cytobacillus horneckiae]PKG30540.1 flagellar type III secretion system protein FliR [Cytobacillus horneckiae]